MCKDVQLNSIQQQMLTLTVSPRLSISDMHFFTR